MEIAASGNPAFSPHRATDPKPAGAAPVATPAPPVAVQTAAAVQSTAPAISVDDVKQAVQDINQSMQSLARGLEFTIDANSQRPVVRVVDTETRELIRQIPSAQVLEIARMLDQVLGKLISQQA